MSVPSSLLALVARTEDAASTHSFRPPWKLQVEAHLRHNTRLNNHQTPETLLVQIAQGIQQIQSEWKHQTETGVDGQANEIQRPPVSMLEEIWISVEWMALLAPTVHEYANVARLHMHTLWMLLDSQFKPLHELVNSQFARFAEIPLASEVMMELFEEFLTIQHDGRMAANALSRTGVLSVARLALSQNHPDSQLRKQKIFHQRLLPFIASFITPPSVLTQGMEDKGGMWKSLVGKVYRQILTVFFEKSNPDCESNLVAMYSLITSVSLIDLHHCRDHILVIFLAFIGDQFTQLVDLASRDIIPKEQFFHHLLPVCQIALTASDALVAKQALDLLLKRAEVLYACEEPKQRVEEKGHRGGKQSKPTQQSASSSSSSKVVTRIQRTTSYPDYSLKNWHVNASLWQVLLTNYELHLARMNPEHLECLLVEHETWYSSRPVGTPFTPDIFLELLFRRAMVHSNPYVRKHVYQTMVVSLKDRVRWSQELLFEDPDPSDNVSHDAEPSRSILHLLTDPSVQSLLPGAVAIVAFWSTQLARVTLPAERSLWVRKMIGALSNLSPHALHIEAHLTVLADIPSQPPVDGLIPNSELLTAIHSIARLVSSENSSIAREALHVALARVFLQLFSFTAPVDPSESALHLSSIGSVLVSIVPAHLRVIVSDKFRQHLLTELVCAGSSGWMVRGLDQLVREIIHLAETNHPSLTPDEILSRSASIASLLPFLAATDVPQSLSTIVSTLTTARQVLVTTVAVELLTHALKIVSLERSAEARSHATRVDSTFHRAVANIQHRGSTASLPSTPAASISSSSTPICSAIDSSLQSLIPSILDGLFGMAGQLVGGITLSAGASGVSALLRARVSESMGLAIRLYPQPSEIKPRLISLMQQTIMVLFHYSTAVPPNPDVLIEARALHSVYALFSIVRQSGMFGSMAELISTDTSLALIQYLSTITIESKLSPKSLFHAPHFTLSVSVGESPEELKTNWIEGVQQARWRLFEGLLGWMSGDAETARNSTLLPSVSQPSSSLIQAFFQSRASLQSIMTCILDSLDGAGARSWPSMIRALQACFALEYRFTRAAEELLADRSPILAEAHQQSVLAWIVPKDSNHLRNVLDRVWRSFQEIASRRGHGISTIHLALDSIDMKQWSCLPSSASTVAPSTQDADHALPAAHEAMVELMLHPSVLTSTERTLVVKTFVASLLTFAQKRGLRTLQYAMALKLVVVCSSSPSIGIAFIPELAVLLTLDRRFTDSVDTADPYTPLPPVAVPMEHLIRVLVLTLFEHLAQLVSTSGRSDHGDSCYSFLAHTMHHFLQLNFHHAEYAVDQCGGEEESAAASAGSITDAPAPPKQSSAQRALTALWHVLCILSTVHLRANHCLASSEWSATAANDGSDMSQSLETVLPKPKQKSRTKAQHKAAAAGNLASSSSSSSSSSGGAFSIVTPMPADFPLLHFIHHHALLLLISPSLPSALRHLIEIFLINFFARNAEGDEAGGKLVEKVLLPYLDRTVYKQNVISSILVITGFLCSKLVRLDWLARQAGGNARFSSLISSLFSRLHIWTQSPLGQVRSVASWLFFQLFQEVYHGHLFTLDGRSVLPKGFEVRSGLAAPAQTKEVMRIETEPIPSTMLSVEAQADVLFMNAYMHVFFFLYRSPQLAILRARQDQFFRAFRPFDRTTVEGLIQYAQTYEHAEFGSAFKGGGNAAVVDDADSHLGPGTIAPSSVLLRVGVDLPAEDLLQHVRSVTAHWLDALREEREFAYYSDRRVEGKDESLSAWKRPDDLAHPSSLAPHDIPSTNFQQKIAPLKSQLIEAADAVESGARAPVEANDEETGDDSSMQARLPPGRHLILCASLVSKPVNLGGLCRTAEIMSCSLVLEDARLLRDATFTNVSSTANRWADISIVARDDLRDWLMSMKGKGYSIVGLEQTAHSTPLQTARFAEKVILVLGDEKQGIPVSILNLLDECIVIPQFGLIRSLNVHVSGGMVIWEYIKQCIEQTNDSTSASGLE